MYHRPILMFLRYVYRRDISRFVFRPDTSGPERVERRLCMHGARVEPFIACDALCSWRRILIKILKLRNKTANSVTSRRGVGATDGLRATPIWCPDPGRPRPGLVPGLAEVRSTGPATRSARPAARARAASVSRFQTETEFQKDSSERVLRYTWRALGRIDDVRHGAASGTFPRPRGCI